jgi:DNA-binding CsgD family transcriptional regulator
MDTNLDTVMDLMGIEKLTAKEKASKLKAKGITQKCIADYVQVSLPTIKRWWPNL